ncbi:MAG: ROK family protein [Eubacteriales bacterium]|nr:ROK family protein [Eubacteriales bacterium]
MKLAGLDIGGTKCAVITADYTAGHCCITRREEFPTAQFSTPQDALEKFAAVLDQCSFDALGISCGGPLDSASGLILSPPNLPGWDRVAITDFFTRRFGVPCALRNDANACAWAEWKLGAGRGTRNMVFLTFGTGLGAGLILDGRLYAGSNDMAGEAGHISLAPFGPVGYGKAGSMEGFCSGGGIRQLALMKLTELAQCGQRHPLHALGAAVSARDVFEGAHKGDALCQSIVETVGTQLGRGLAILIDLLNPQAIVIGSIYARNEALLQPLVEKASAAQALPRAMAACAILPAALGEQIGDYAAVMTAPGVG